MGNIIAQIDSNNNVVSIRVDNSNMISDENKNKLINYYNKNGVLKINIKTKKVDLMIQNYLRFLKNINTNLESTIVQNTIAESTSIINSINLYGCLMIVDPGIRKVEGFDNQDYFYEIDTDRLIENWGWARKAFNAVKSGVTQAAQRVAEAARQAAEATRRVALQAAERARWAAQQAAEATRRAAQQAAERVRWAAQQAAEGARRAAEATRRAALQAAEATRRAALQAAARAAEAARIVAEKAKKVNWKEVANYVVPVKTFEKIARGEKLNAWDIVDLVSSVPIPGAALLKTGGKVLAKAVVKQVAMKGAKKFAKDQFYRNTDLGRNIKQKQNEAKSQLKNQSNIARSNIRAGQAPTRGISVRPVYGINRVTPVRPVYGINRVTPVRPVYGINRVTPVRNTYGINRPIKNIFKPIGRAVSPAVMKIGRALSPAAQQIRRAVSPAAQQIRRALSPAVMKIGRAVSPAAQQIRRAVSPAVMKIGRAVSPAVKKIVRAVSPAVMKIGRAVSPAVKKIVRGKAVSPAAKKIKKILKPITKAISPALTPIRRVISPALKPIKKIIKPISKVISPVKTVTAVAGAALISSRPKIDSIEIIIPKILLTSDRKEFMDFVSNNLVSSSESHKLLNIMRYIFDKNSLSSNNEIKTANLISLVARCSIINQIILEINKFGPIIFSQEDKNNFLSQVFLDLFSIIPSDRCLFNDEENVVNFTPSVCKYKPSVQETCPACEECKTPVSVVPRSETPVSETPVSETPVSETPRSETPGCPKCQKKECDCLKCNKSKGPFTTINLVIIAIIVLFIILYLTKKCPKN